VLHARHGSHLAGPPAGPARAPQAARRGWVKRSKGRSTGPLLYRPGGWGPAAACSSCWPLPLTPMLLLLLLLLLSGFPGSARPTLHPPPSTCVAGSRPALAQLLEAAPPPPSPQAATPTWSTSCAMAACWAPWPASGAAPRCRRG
jgi:hypothetical protein